MSNDLIINQTDGGDYVLRFTRHKFEDFVDSLLRSPRVDAKSIQRGFYMKKDDIVNLVERINHRVQTQNHVIKNFFSCTVDYEDSYSKELNSLEQFQFEDLNRTSKVGGVSVRLSYLIVFNRDGDPQPEKQTIYIQILPNELGEFNVKIESTDLTWPADMIRLIENEISNLPHAFTPAPKWATDYIANVFKFTQEFFFFIFMIGVVIGFISFIYITRSDQYIISSDQQYLEIFSESHKKIYPSAEILAEKLTLSAKIDNYNLLPRGKNGELSKSVFKKIMNPHYIFPTILVILLTSLYFYIGRLITIQNEHSSYGVLIMGPGKPKKFNKNIRHKRCSYIFIIGNLYFSNNIHTIFNSNKLTVITSIYLYNFSIEENSAIYFCPVWKSTSSQPWTTINSEK